MPKSLSNIKGYRYTFLRQLQCIKSLTGQKQFQRIQQRRHACWICGELWNRKPVFEKDRVWQFASTPYLRLCVTVRRALLEIIVPWPPVVLRQEEISGAATGPFTNFLTCWTADINFPTIFLTCSLCLHYKICLHSPLIFYTNKWWWLWRLRSYTLQLISQQFNLM